MTVRMADLVQGDQTIDKMGWALRYFAKRLLGHAFACIAALAVTISLSDVRAANDAPIYREGTSDEFFSNRSGGATVYV